MAKLHKSSTLILWLMLPSIIHSLSPSQQSTARRRQYKSFGSNRSSIAFAPHPSVRILFSTAAADNQDGSTASSSVSKAAEKQPSQKSKKRTDTDLPWSDIQEWALKDNLPKFTVIISTNGSSSKQYAMWRTLTREVTELAGYPIPFLMQKLSSFDKDAITPGVLPMVDDFEFAPNGGITGRAYGLPGIADGTRINTPALIGVETTVPLGYVTTTVSDRDEEGIGFSYELGTCASSSVYSLDGSERSAALLSARRMMMEGMDVGVASSRQVASVAKEAMVAGSGLLTDTEANQDLVYLGGATAMLLASATAVGMLSHHLTVNVFWV